MRKFSNDQVVEIRRLASGGNSLRALSKRFDVSVGAIQKIVFGETYKDCNGPILERGTLRPRQSNRGGRNGNAKLNNHQVITIRREIIRGVPRSVLAKQFGVSRSTIDRIGASQTWSDALVHGGVPKEFPDKDLFEIDLRKVDRPRRGSDEEKALIQRVFEAYRTFGYPYRQPPTSLKGYLEKLVNSPVQVSDGTLYGGSVTGLSTLTAFHPYFDHVNRKGCKSPVDVFHDDDLFKSAILGQIRYGSKFTPYGIRSALTERSGSSQISAFRPSVALSLIKHFGATRVLDPCAGWGGRMVGAIALGVDYVGIDPSTHAISGNRTFLETLSRDYKSLPGVTLIQECAEDAIPGNTPLGTFDLVLTSPPYFDLEHYAVESTQSYLRYPSKEVWYDQFMRRMLDGCRMCLEDGGRIALNIYDQMVDDTIHAASRANLTLDGVIYIEFPARRWQRATGTNIRREPVIILRRADAT